MGCHGCGEDVDFALLPRTVRSLLLAVAHVACAWHMVCFASAAVSNARTTPGPKLFVWALLMACRASARDSETPDIPDEPVELAVRGVVIPEVAHPVLTGRP